MKKFIVLAIALLLAMGVALNNGIANEPAIVSSDGAPAISGDLPSLGPIELVALEYTKNFGAACVDLGESAIYFAAFSAVDLGSSATISSAAAVNGSIGLSGGTVALLGTTSSGDCDPGQVDSVIGFFDDMAQFTANIFLSP